MVVRDSDPGFEEQSGFGSLHSILDVRFLARRYDPAEARNKIRAVLDADGATLRQGLEEALQRSRGTLAAKDILDRLLSIAALLMLAPLLGLLALLIRLDSPGAAIIRQRRHGRNGHAIDVFKFRTMRIDLCDCGTAQAVQNDPRITGLGAILRRFSLDELPQLWNVIRGEMSIVGPRAHPIGMQAGGRSYEELVPAYHLRHLIKPGLTGLAQVNGFRGPTVDSDMARQRVAHDLIYIADLSFVRDIKIMFTTLRREIWSEHAF